MEDLDYRFYLKGECSAYISIPTYNMTSGKYAEGKGWIPTDDTEGGPRNRSFNVNDICCIHKLEELDKYDKDATFLKPQCECSILKTIDGHSWYVKGNCDELNKKIKKIFTRFYEDKKRFEKEFDEFERKFKNN